MTTRFFTKPVAHSMNPPFPASPYPHGVPETSDFSGVEWMGYTILTASDIMTAKNAIATALVRGATGGNEYHTRNDNPVAEKWAVVQRSKI